MDVNEPDNCGPTCIFPSLKQEIPGQKIKSFFKRLEEKARMKESVSHVPRIVLHPSSTINVALKQINDVGCLWCRTTIARPSVSGFYSYCSVLKKHLSEDK